MVESANGLFIWVATAFKFLSEGVSAAEELRILLEKSSAPGSPEGNLDKLHLTVLRNSIKPTFTEGERQRAHDRLKEILGSIVVLKLSCNETCVWKCSVEKHSDGQWGF